MSRWARLGVLCLFVFATSGCLRYHAELQVDAAGTVSGQLVVAVKTALPSSLVQQFDVPPPIRSKVVVSHYDADGYVGSAITFDRLSVDEVGQLFSGGQPDRAPVQISITRTGDRIVVAGAASFPEMSPVGGNNGFDARIALTFLGASSVTGNGTVSGKEVTWSPRPGRPIILSAQAVFPQPARAASATAPRPGYPARLLAVLAGLLVVLAAGVALLLARRRARRARRAVPLPDTGDVAGRQPGLRPTLALPTEPLPREPAAAPVPAPVPAPDPVPDPEATRPTDPLGPYAGRYRAVPSGPGLSPESTQRLSTAPPPGAADRPYRRDQAGW